MKGKSWSLSIVTTKVFVITYQFLQVCDRIVIGEKDFSLKNINMKKKMSAASKLLEQWK
jgi:hypothetical protein